MIKKCLIGIFTGILCGLFSSGGGMILLPACIYFFKLNEKEARSTTIFCILPMVITTTIIYSKNQQINWNSGIKLAIGGVIGAFLGTKLLNKISNKWLKIVFIIFLFYAIFNLLK